MSLNQLPQELVAQMASHLNYEDVWNLMESSKRMYKIVKGYGREKIKLERLGIVGDSRPIPQEIREVEAYCLAEDGSKKVYNLKNLNVEEENTIEVIKKLFKNCSSIDLLFFGEITFTSEFFQLFNHNKIKFGTLHFYSRDIQFTPDEFISFCQKFKSVECIYINFNRNLWSDQTIVDRGIEHVYYNFGTFQSEQARDVRLYIDEESGKFLRVFEVDVTVIENYYQYQLTYMSLTVRFKILKE